MSTETPRADAAAAAVGAVDLFVLRRVSGEQFVHFGGSGRGAGWAGIVDVETGESEALSSSLTTRAPSRVVHTGKDVVFGPYYANAAAFVPVTNDVVVVFGFEQAPEDASDEALHAAATMAADAVGDVTPAKRLADELEELEAVRAALAVDTQDHDPHSTLSMARRFCCRPATPHRVGRSINGSIMKKSSRRSSRSSKTARC